MKNIIIKQILALSLILISVSSCKKALDINTSPNSPSLDKGTPELIFPSAVASTAGTLGSEYAILGGIWSQYWTQSAAASQYRYIDSYNVTQSDFNGRFNEVFSGALNDYQFSIKKAEETGKWNFFLMSTVMKAYTYQVMVDLYDNLPYSEAFKGQDNLTPKYDNGADIYAGLLSEIDNALAQNYASSPSAGSVDLVFGGDIDKWVRFANTLKLKMYLRMVYANPSVAEAGIKSLYTSNAQFLNTDASLATFKNEINASNPLYEFNNRALGNNNLRASRTFLTFLMDNNDPRIEKYFTKSGASYIGINQGDYTNTDPTLINVSIAIFNALDPVHFISAAESYFLQAEALERLSNGTGAQAAYNQGVAAAFAQNGFGATVSAPFYAVGGKYAYPATGTFEQKLEKIIVQKWASFPGSHALEGFFEKNRTGYPKTSTLYSTHENYIPGQFVYPKTGFTNGIFPKRLIYPESESKTNPNTPAIVPLTQKIWWDKK
jgi:hypothetical protein